MSEREDVTFLQGDAMEVLASLESESVHLCVTSPPYWGLRDYGTGHWEGGSADCGHKAAKLKSRYDYPMPASAQVGTHKGMKAGTDAPRWKDECPCGARRIDNQLGLEPTPEAHIERLVEVFRAVRRVMRKDSVLAINYGDCYATSVNGRKVEDGAIRSCGDGGVFKADKPFGTAVGGLKSKDLAGMPFRLALALQADGWWWRSCMPWVKRSAMSESVGDRPSTALEYVLLFARSERYFWDADAVRRVQDSRDPAHPSYRKGFVDGTGHTQTGKRWHAAGDEYKVKRGSEVKHLDPRGRNLRNSDFYFDSLTLAIEQARAELAHLEHLREKGGLLLSEEGEPLALDVNTEAMKMSHFAAFPQKLVAPLVQAATSERGCCTECLAPYVRVTEKGELVADNGEKVRDLVDPVKRDESHSAWSRPGGKVETVKPNHHRETKHLGWRKSCRCETDEVTPAVVLDCFAGTGTVGVVATKLGRRAVLIDLKDDYIQMQKKRNAQVSLLL